MDGSVQASSTSRGRGWTGTSWWRPRSTTSGDRYYLAGTWNDHGHLIENVPRRYNVPTNQTELLVADSPDGPFKPLVRELDYCLGPGDWDIIDGTLYQEDGTTYMVFVHEWTQIIDGTMAYMPLSADLTRRTAEPTTIFRASEAPWSKEMNSIGEATFGLKMPGWVTDGPQLFRTRTGKLGMLWSSWGEHRYAQGVAYSTSGSIHGPWVQEKEPLRGDNSGHGMLFRTFEGKLLFILHHAEGKGPAQARDLERRRLGRQAGAPRPARLLIDRTVKAAVLPSLAGTRRRVAWPPAPKAGGRLSKGAYRGCSSSGGPSYSPGPSYCGPLP